MEKSVQITLIIVVGVVILAVLGFTAFNGANPKNTITANGQANVDAMPDLVGVYFNIDTSAETSEEARDMNAEIVDELTISLLKEGFVKSQIQTQSFNIYPDYRWTGNSREESGYRSNHRIKIELSTDDSGKIGDVIDAGVDAGAMISYINFELSQEKQNEYKAEAIRLASEDARIKAESMAEGLGNKLGRLVSVSDSNFGYNPWMLYETSGVSEDSAMMAKAATTDIQPGEQTIHAAVTAVFKIN